MKLGLFWQSFLRARPSSLGPTGCCAPRRAAPRRAETRGEKACNATAVSYTNRPASKNGVLYRTGTKGRREDRMGGGKRREETSPVSRRAKGQ